MERIKIKQLGERVSTMGLHMGGDARRRKLEPGEVVEIPDDLMDEGLPLFEQLWQTGAVDLTRDAPTRPLDYDSIAEAKLCSPSFKPRDDSEHAAQEKALAAVAARLEKLSAKSGKGGGKSADKAPAREDKARTNRRAARRQALGTLGE